MTFDLFVTAALDVAFFALVGVSLLAYLRDRTPVKRDIVLLFCSVAVVLAVPLARHLIPSIPAEAPIVAAVLLLAQPLLTMVLIAHFREGMRPYVLASLALFLVASAALVLLQPTPPPLVALAIVGYFVGVDLIAASLFALEARHRIGAARTRLFLAATGTLLLGAAILIAGAASVIAARQAAGASAPRGAAGSDPVMNTLSRLIALLAAISYLAAFVPPQRLRDLWQRSVAYEYLRDLVLTPSDGERDILWARLAAAARRISGARATAVAVGPAVGDVVIRAVDGEWGAGDARGDHFPRAALALGTARRGRLGREADLSEPGVARLVELSGAGRVLSLPLEVYREEQGALLLFVSRDPLFVEDDLALLGVLNAHTSRSVERETALAERTALVEQLRRMNAELTHASSAKSDFLAAMSHELRTPLHAIIGFSELLLTDSGNGATRAAADHDVREFASHIHGAGLHLLELINDVLDMARVEAGKLDLQYAPFDLSALVHRTARTMQPLASRKQIALKFPDPAGISVNADAARMRQVVFNLLSNAIKFTPEGGRVDVAVEAGDGQVELSVSDTGRGIPAADQARIFEPFHQSDQGDATRQEGTGLGLALTRQLVEGHGGRIELESAPGRGSTFRVVLPLGTRDGTAALPTLRATQPAPDGSPLVLLVEDDARAAELLNIYLRGAG